MMGEVTTQNIYSSLQKYNKLYTVASGWTIIDTVLLFLETRLFHENGASRRATTHLLQYSSSSHSNFYRKSTTGSMEFL
jgi:hypothetical protein